MNVISTLAGPRGPDGGAQAAPAAPPPARGGRAPALSPRDIVLLVNRRKWHMAGVVALVMALVGLALSQMTPMYRGSALVMLDARKLRVTKVEEVMQGIATSDTAALQTEVEILRSRSLLERVVEKLKLEDDEEFARRAPAAGPWAWWAMARAEADRILGRTAPPPPPPDAARERRRAQVVERVADALTIAPRGRSYVILVQFESADARKAALIANTIAGEYIVDQLNAKLEANRIATTFLTDRLLELKRNVETAERAVAEYRSRHNLTMGSTSTVTAQSQSEVNTQLNIARAELASKRSRLQSLQAAERNPGGAAAIPEVLANPLIGALRGQEAEVSRQVGDLSQRYGDAHPRLMQARGQLGEIQGKIRAEIAKIATSVRAEVAAAESKEAELKGRLDTAERQSGDTGQAMANLKPLEREAESSRAIYEQFLTRSKELREQQDIQQPDARVLSAATTPASPSSPRYTLTLALALTLSSALALGLILLLEKLDGGYRSTEQIEAALGLPAVGMIPGLSRLTLGGRNPARFAIEKPTSSYGESLRSAHTAIMLGNLDQPPKVVMITSSLPGEGKTTFAVSLAALLARSSSGKRVVVVDCDLRRPNVARTIGGKATGGTIDEHLSGAKTLEEILGRDEASGLFYITARPNTPNPTEILESNTMRRFIEKLADEYDLVVLDTPPVMAVSDSRILSRLANYVVFLVRWEKTPREIVGNATRLLRDVNKRVGVVMSQVNVRRHSKYGYGDVGYYYSKYKSYYTS